MENKNNPLSPHLQFIDGIYHHLLSIAHRIVGIINYYWLYIFIFICIIFLANNSQIFSNNFTIFFGKFFIISLCWSFSFQILNEIRHLAGIWDMVLI